MTPEQEQRYKQDLQSAITTLAHAITFLDASMAEPCHRCGIKKANTYDEFREAQELSGVLGKLVRFKHRLHPDLPLESKEH